MQISILYCAECELVVAASLGLTLAAECACHEVKGVRHTGYRALRVPIAAVEPAVLADLSALASVYPKDQYADQLEPLAGVCQ